MKIRMMIPAVLLCSITLASAQGRQTQYMALLDSAQEHNPANTSPASGFGTFILNADNSITYSVTYSGLIGNWSASHIHGSATSFPGFDAGVLYTLNNNPIDTHSGVLSGTTAPLTAQHIAWLELGTLYANIHSSGTGGFPGGEIRGQIVPVPEPSTWALMGFGALGLLWSVLRKKA